MTVGYKYLLDSNVLIEAKKRWYSFDVCPGFWDSLLGNYKVGVVKSIDFVKSEVLQNDDELTEWVCNRVPDEFFDSTNDEAVIQHYQDVQKWVATHSAYKPEAKATFADFNLADPWLIAYAKSFDFTVVTHETFEKDRINKVKIPNVCNQFGVKWIDTFKMLENLRTVFIWQDAND